MEQDSSNTKPKELSSSVPMESLSTASTLTSTTKPPYPHWHSIVSGGMAGFASRMVTAPLDLIRIRRQLNIYKVTYPSESFWTSWKNIVQNEGGIPALYRGNMAAIYLWIGYAAVQFSVYNSAKDALRTHLVLPPDTSSVVVSFCAGGMAGICATLVTYPFDVCRTTFSARGLAPNTANASSSSTAVTMIPEPNRMSSSSQRHLPLSSLYEPPLFPSTKAASTATAIKSATVEAKPIHPNFPISSPSAALSSTIHSSTTPIPRTFLEFVHQMYQIQGLRGFYAGASPAIIQIIPYMGLNFAIYDWLISLDRKDTKTSIGLSAYAGSVSGALSKMLVYPMDTVKRRLQAQAFFTTSPMHDNVSRRRHYNGMWDCILTIYRTEGWMSFYRGIVPSVAKTAISTSLTFSCFHWTQNTLEWIHDLRH